MIDPLHKPRVKLEMLLFCEVWFFGGDEIMSLDVAMLLAALLVLCFVLFFFLHVMTVHFHFAHFAPVCSFLLVLKSIPFLVPRAAVK